MVCDFLHTRSGDSKKVCFVWVTIDAAILTWLLTTGDAAASRRLILFPAMIVASGFWFRLPLVAYTTILALLSYAVLAVNPRVQEDNLPGSDDHGVFFIAVLLTGLLVAMQVHCAHAIREYFAATRRS